MASPAGIQTHDERTGGCRSVCPCGHQPGSSVGEVAILSSCVVEAGASDERDLLGAGRVLGTPRPERQHLEWWADSASGPSPATGRAGERPRRVRPTPQMRESRCLCRKGIAPVECPIGGGARTRRPLTAVSSVASTEVSSNPSHPRDPHCPPSAAVGGDGPPSRGRPAASIVSWPQLLLDQRRN